MNMMKRNSKPVAVTILNDIAMCEDIEGMVINSHSPALTISPDMTTYFYSVSADMPSLEYLPARTVSELRVSAEYLIAQSAGGEE